VPVPQIPSTTLTTQPRAPKSLCEQVFDTAKAIGWPTDQLGMVVAIAMRESRCQPDAYNASDPNGGLMGLCKSTGSGVSLRGTGLTDICRHTGY
jgi:hypothetical protein